MPGAGRGERRWIRRPAARIQVPDVCAGVRGARRVEVPRGRLAWVDTFERLGVRAIPDSRSAFRAKSRFASRRFEDPLRRSWPGGTASTRERFGVQVATWGRGASTFGAGARSGDPEDCGTLSRQPWRILRPAALTLFALGVHFGPRLTLALSGGGYHAEGTTSDSELDRASGDPVDGDSQTLEGGGYAAELGVWLHVARAGETDLQVGVAGTCTADSLSGDVEEWVDGEGEEPGAVTLWPAYRVWVAVSTWRCAANVDGAREVGGTWPALPPSWAWRTRRTRRSTWPVPAWWGWRSGRGG